MSNKNKYGVMFITPFLIVFIAFNIYPFISTFLMSFTDYKGFGESNFIGLANYIRAFKDVMLREAFINTFKIWGVNIILQLGLALILTIIFSDLKYKIKGLSLFRAIFYLPNLITASSVAVLFKILLDWQYGAINQMLLSSGMIDNPVNWLSNTGTASLWVSLIQSWMWFGNTFIILMAGVQGINKEYYEAGSIDGATSFQMFKKITIPLLKPILLYVGVTSLIGGMQLFEIPFLLTDGLGAPQGSLNTAVMYLYNTAFRFNNVGYAASIAYLLFAVIMIFTGITYFGINGKEAKK